MNNRIISSLVAALMVTGVSSSAFAQQNSVEIAGHPRISEVDSRLQNEQKRVDAGVKGDQINAKQEMRDENHMQKIEEQVSKDEAMHNGHLTKKEQRHLNKELNVESRKIYQQRHEGVNDKTTTSVGAGVASPAAPATGTSN